MGQNRTFCVLNFHENAQNSRNSRKFLLAKFSAPKVNVFIFIWMPRLDWDTDNAVFKIILYEKKQWL